ncbi:MAG: hypothetical protein U0941_01550 [Planctomycetaceae bacterium]
MVEWRNSVLTSISVRIFNLVQEVSLDDMVSFQEQIDYVNRLERILCDHIPAQIHDAIPYVLGAIKATTAHGSELLSNPTQEAFNLWVIFATHLLLGMMKVLSRFTYSPD